MLIYKSKSLLETNILKQKKILKISVLINLNEVKQRKLK